MPGRRGQGGGVVSTIQRNETRFKSLDRMAGDPRIVRIWDEDRDGIWAELAPGYNFDGCSCLHEWTVREMLRAWRTRISEGPTY